MREITDLQKDLYVEEVERLIKRPVDPIEAKAIMTAFIQQRSSLEAVKLIFGTSDRIDRQNDFA